MAAPTIVVSKKELQHVSTNQNQQNTSMRELIEDVHLVLVEEKVELKVFATVLKDLNFLKAWIWSTVFQELNNIHKELEQRWKTLMQMDKSHVLKQHSQPLGLTAGGRNQSLKEVYGDINQSLDQFSHMLKNTFIDPLHELETLHGELSAVHDKVKKIEGFGFTSLFLKKRIDAALNELHSSWVTMQLAIENGNEKEGTRLFKKYSVEIESATQTITQLLDTEKQFSVLLQKIHETLGILLVRVSSDTKQAKNMLMTSIKIKSIMRQAVEKFKDDAKIGKTLEKLEYYISKVYKDSRVFPREEILRQSRQTLYYQANTLLEKINTLRKRNESLIQQHLEHAKQNLRELKELTA